MGDLRQAIKLVNKMCDGTERYFRRAKKTLKKSPSLSLNISIDGVPSIVVLLLRIALILKKGL